MQRFASQVNQNLLFKKVPQILSLSKQICDIKFSEHEIAEVKRLKSEFIQLWDKKMEKRFPFQRLKGWLLILAYLDGTKIENMKMQEDLNYILEKSPGLLKCLFSVALQLSRQKNFDPNTNLHFVGYRATKNIFRFSQYFIQGISPVYGSEFEQIPHFNDKFLDIFQKKYRKSLRVFAQLTPEERWNMKQMSKLEEHRNEIELFISKLPKIECSAKIYVAQQEKIQEGDMITVQVQLNRFHKFNQFESLKFPYEKQQVWYILITLQDKNLVLYHFVFSSNQNPGTSHSMKLPPFPKGFHTFAIDFICDSYIGFDQHRLIEIQVNAYRSTGRKIIQYAQEDQEVEKETNIFGIKQVDSDEDLFESESEQEDVIEVPKVKQKKRGGTKKGKAGSGEKDKIE